MAHDKILIFDTFYNMLEGLEEYIEKSGNYPGFVNKRQIYKKTVPQGANLSLNKAESLFRTQLLIFAGMEKPDFLGEKIKEEYYRWINAVGIDANNCPDEKLKHFLLEINNVIEGEDEKIINQTKDYLDNKEKTNPTSPWDMLKVFNAFQGPLDKNREQAELLKDKTHRDMKTESKFNSNTEKGQETFGQLTGSVANRHSDFHFYPQTTSSASDYVSLNSPHPTNPSEVVQEVKKSPQNWSIDEIDTEINSLGWTKKKEFVLYCRHARFNDYDQEGKLNFNNNPIYRWETFNSRERFEVKKAKNISGDYLTADEVKWVVREFKNDLSVWEIKEIKGQTCLVHNSAQIKDNEIGTLIHSKQKFNRAEWAEINGMLERVNAIKRGDVKLERGLFVINQETSEISENEDWFISTQLRREVDNRTGYLVHVPNAMIRVKDLSEAEREVIGYKSEQSLQNLSTSGTENDNKGIGAGGIFAIIGVVSALVIGGVVVVRKKLNKKNR